MKAFFNERHMDWRAIIEIAEMPVFESKLESAVAKHIILVSQLRYYCESTI